MHSVSGPRCGTLLVSFAIFSWRTSTPTSHTPLALWKRKSRLENECGEGLNMRSSNTLPFHRDTHGSLCLSLLEVTELEGETCLIQGWSIRKTLCHGSKVNIPQSALSRIKLISLCPAVCQTSAFSLSIVFWFGRRVNLLIGFPKTTTHLWNAK